MRCELCGKNLQKKEVNFCSSCLPFIEWKYGTLEKYKTERGGKKE